MTTDNSNYPVIRKGARGSTVLKVQKILHLAEDGIFGDLTDEVVREFQKSRGLSADGIVGVKTWAALLDGSTAATRKIDEIIIHCSATPEGKDYTVSQIRQWHLARGFADIGYHYVIYRDGSIHKGRPEYMAGAHCLGHNTRSIGICYVGGCAKDSETPKDTRTQAQKDALRRLVEGMQKKYPGATVHGHREFANKACPSFDVKTDL